MAKSVLVTLTAPSNAGKSHLLNYIRETAKLPCLVSTTTRPPRKGEVEGVDYFFITDEESKIIEANNGFAELMEYNGYRYGVSKEEFSSKLTNGVAFLIVEPHGIKNYVAPALNVGALHLNCFVDTLEELRIHRMKERFAADLELLDSPEFNPVAAKKALSAHFNRLITMLTSERKWHVLHNWDLVLDGTDDPEWNTALILNAVKIKLKADQIRQDLLNIQDINKL